MCDSRGDDLRYVFDFDGDGAEDFRGQCRATRTFTFNGISGESEPPSTLTKTFQSVMRVFEAGGQGTEDGDAFQTNTITITKLAGTTTTTTTFPALRGDNFAKSPDAAPSAGAHGVVVGSALEVAGGSGQVMLNGTGAAFAGRGRSQAMLAGRRGENRIEAQLVEAKAGGFWRFELTGTDGLQRGSLRVVAGDVALVTDEAIVFRLSGRPGERVVFTFRTTGR
jgi:hypothetical protein